jgi:macrocin-O-methyltransferase TylF-like protien
LRADLGKVASNLESFGYRMDHKEFAKGRVEEAISRVVPERISVFRIDAALFESSCHELEYLY